jgi:hypothetical protein
MVAASCGTAADTSRSSDPPADKPGPAASVPVSSAPTGNNSVTQPGQKRALLIGVTEFMAGPMKKHNLEGPANDAELFRTVLQREPFRVPDTNIRVLAGLPADAARRPTRANIEREFRALAKAATKGDQVVILMAGHGSQQPANNDPQDDEPDGMDEIFLPADATGWDGATGTVGNAIVDDDIRRWLADVRQNGASVWIVFDSCQSGTMTRGAPTSVERERRIDPAELIPREVLAKVRSTSRGAGAEDAILGLGSTGEIAALFAANMSETTPERRWTETGPVHGLFSHTIATILSQNRTAMTYRELGQRVTERYRSMPRWAPNPMMEGAGLDREILGLRTWPDRPRIVFRELSSNGDWTLDAGSIQGVTRGSVLEVFPPAGTANADTAIGHVVVKSDEPTSARVAPIAFATVPAPPANRLVAGSRARVRVHDPGSLRLKVAVQHAGPSGEHVLAPASAVPPALNKALADFTNATAGLAEVVRADPADWYLRVIDGSVVLVPAAGWQSTSRPAGVDSIPPQFTAGPLTAPDLALKLATAFRRIGSASNLLRLGALPDSEARLELRVRRYASATDPKSRPLFSTPRDFVIKDGEFVDFVIRNTGDKELDVTLLFINAKYGIQTVFPPRNRDLDNQVKRGEERVVGRLRVTGEPTGWESLVAIGVESTLTRRNFGMLEQDGLELRSATRGGGDSALQRLLEAAVGGRTRGDLEPVETFVVKVVSWRTDPK